MKILVAEDEVKVASFLRKGLEEAGYAVDLAADGDEAVWLAENNTYDAWVLAFPIVERGLREVVWFFVMILALDGLEFLHTGGHLVLATLPF